MIQIKNHHIASRIRNCILQSSIQFQNNEFISNTRVSLHRLLYVCLSDPPNKEAIITNFLGT